MLAYFDQPDVMVPYMVATKKDKFATHVEVYQSIQRPYNKIGGLAIGFIDSCEKIIMTGSYVVLLALSLGFKRLEEVK